MKLNDAIIMGKFCGLQEIEECVLNVELHYLQLLTPDEACIEYKELMSEYEAYLNNNLEIDWKYIEFELEKLDKELNEEFNK